jgi:hypothetical protein
VCQPRACGFESHRGYQECFQAEERLGVGHVGGLGYRELMTERFPEAGRLSAHVLLDAVSTYEHNAPEDLNASAMNLALRRLNEIDGVLKATMSEEDTLSLDASNLLGGAIVTLSWLIEQLAAARGVERLAVVAQVREFLDAA